MIQYAIFYARTKRDGVVLMDSYFVMPVHRREGLIAHLDDILHPQETLVIQKGHAFDNPTQAAHAAIELALQDSVPVQLWEVTQPGQPIPLPDTPKRWSSHDKLRELRREMTMRRKLYPGWVDKKTMTAEAAERQLAILAEIVADYEILAEYEQPQLSLGEL